MTDCIVGFLDDLISPKHTLLDDFFDLTPVVVYPIFLQEVHEITPSSHSVLILVRIIIAVPYMKSPILIMYE